MHRILKVVQDGSFGFPSFIGRTPDDHIALEGSQANDCVNQWESTSVTRTNEKYTARLRHTCVHVKCQAPRAPQSTNFLGLDCCVVLLSGQLLYWVSSCARLPVPKGSLRGRSLPSTTPPRARSWPFVIRCGVQLLHGDVMREVVDSSSQYVLCRCTM